MYCREQEETSQKASQKLENNQELERMNNKKITNIWKVENKETSV